MFGWLKNLFASDPVKAIGDAVDKFTFTGQEKAEANRKYLEVLTAYQQATLPQNVARRFIAVLIVGGSLLFAIAAAIAWPFNPQYADFLLNLFTKIMLSADIIIAFYFVKGFIKR